MRTICSCGTTTFDELLVSQEELFKNEVDEVIAVPSTLPSKYLKDGKYRCFQTSINDFHMMQEFALANGVNNPTTPTRTKDEAQWKNDFLKIMQTTITSSSLGQPLPMCVIFEEEEQRDQDGTKDSYAVNGLALWTFGFSPRKGRIMILETFHTRTDDCEKDRKVCMSFLMRIAKSLGCSRLVHKTKEIDVLAFFRDELNTNVNKKMLTFSMEQKEIKSFISSRCEWVKQFQLRPYVDTTNESVAIRRRRVGGISESKEQSSCALQDRNSWAYIDSVSSKIDNALSTMEAAFDGRFKINQKKVRDSSEIRLRLRRAVEADADNILSIVKERARYKKALDQVVTVNSSIYKQDGLEGNGPKETGKHPLFHCILVEAMTDLNELSLDTESMSITRNKVEVVGLGFWNLGFSLSSGKYLFLEDLYVDEKYRRNGCAKAIMHCLVEIASNLKCDRIIWQALDCNILAADFCSSMGANVCQGLMTLKLDLE